MSVRSGPLGKAAAVIVGVALSLGLVEIASRVLGLDEFEIQLTMWKRFGPTLRYDERFGWVNLPGKMGTNRQGFRFPRDYTEPKTKSRRIAVVGDSQVFGLWVKEKQHLGVLLDALLPDLEAYSFGVPGYDPCQELLLVEHVLERYELDGVVAVTFLENDLIDATHVMAYGHLQKPYMYRDKGRWRIANLPVPMPIVTGDQGRSFWQQGSGRFLRPVWGLYDASAAYRLVTRRAAALPRLAEVLSAARLASVETLAPTSSVLWSSRRWDGRLLRCSLISNCPEENWLDGLPAALAAYAEMERLLAERGVAFAVLVTPTMTELERDHYPVSDAISAALEKRGVQVIDLRQVFRAAGNPNLVIAPRPNLHWTRRGHRHAAGAIAKWAADALGNGGG